MEENPGEARWTPEVGERLRLARGSMSKREAARRAGFSEATWRALELGVRRPAKDVEVPVNPTVENLIAAAAAVGIVPADLLRAAGVAPREPQPIESIAHLFKSPEIRIEEHEERLGAIDERLERIEGLLEQIAGQGSQRPKLQIVAFDPEGKVVAADLTDEQRAEIARLVDEGE